MAERKPEWPEVGDLIIATIETITDYGAYAKLDEFRQPGLLHVSEISSSWIKNIRDFVRENQKVVLKVLRVDQEKGHIDLSLRKVTNRERIEKIKSWKKERKADTLLREVAEKISIPVDDLNQKVGTLLEQKYGLYEGFERLVKDGPEALTKLGVEEKLAKAFAQVAEERIQVKMVKVRGTIEVRCTKPNGMKCIQDSFASAKKLEKTREAKIEFFVTAPPMYSVEVAAENWKRAEELIQKVGQTVITNVTEAGGECTFRREK
jgi:translation initiation factor 2 subunit 1